MSENVMLYKKHNIKVGRAMLVLLAGTLTLSLCNAYLFDLCTYVTVSCAEAEMLYHLLYTLIYALVFIIPVLIFKGKDTDIYKSDLGVRIKISRHLWLLIFGGIALNIIASFINASVIDIFGSSTNAVNPFSSSSNNILVQGVLLILRIAVVPAICEELLFRGLILGLLEPFGRARAILFSAIFFALAHQNPEQIFYTFILGLFLGYMTFESGSILGGVLLHFSNNIYQLTNSLILYVAPQNVAIMICSLLRLILLLFGVVCLIHYIVRHGKSHISAHWLYDAGSDISVAQAAVGFFVPETVLFLIISIFMTVINYVF